MTNDAIDVEALRELKEIMEDQFEMLVQTFLDDSEIRIGEIDAAISAGDADALRKAAHSFKGSSSNLGISSLADLCMKLETKGREGSTSGCAPILADVRELFETVRGVLQSEL